MWLPKGSKTVGRVYAKAIMDFDKRIKGEFRNNGQRWAVDVGIESVWPEADIDEGYMVFTNDEIQKCFEPVIGRILELMKNQVLAVQSQYKTLGVRIAEAFSLGITILTRCIEFRALCSLANLGRLSIYFNKLRCMCPRPTSFGRWTRGRLLLKGPSQRACTTLHLENERDRH